MADNDQAKIRYDDFVSKVQADPASPQTTIMLAGYAGRGPEGYARIYPDPTLGNWYDVPEADIVHSMPIADSKLGGSYVWIKSSAAIRPGSAAAAAPQGPMPGAAPAGGAAAAAHLPTAVTLCADCGQTPVTLCQPTPQTHCFICPPVTQHCTVPPQCPPLTVPPQCPHPTLPPICPVQSLHCPSHPIICTHTLPLHCPTLVNCPTHVNCPNTLHCPSSPIVCDTRPSIAAICTHLPACLPHTQPIICQQVISNPAICGVPVTTPQLTTPQFGQAGVQQAQPQAFVAPAPAPAAGPQAAAVHQVISQHQICPTPSAVQQCGQPQPTHAVLCTQVFICGSVAHSQCAVTQCACPSVQMICPTPTAQITHQIVCQQTLDLACLQTVNINCLQTANFNCLQTANTPCIPVTFPTLTPVQNGVFTPFGR